MAHDYLTLTREQLYALVWSKPVAELAKDFGISDVAVAKRLRKLRVPVPGRGYWARVHAGQTPVQIPLPKKEEERADHSALTFAVPPEPVPPAPIESTESDALAAAVSALQITASANFATMHPVVLRTALELKRPWRRDIRWKRNEREGLAVQIKTSETVQDRALVFADRLIRMADELGWKFVAQPADAYTAIRGGYSMPALPPNPRPYGVFDVMGEMISISIEERSRRIPHVLTEDEKLQKRLGKYVYASTWDYEYRGELRVQLLSVENKYIQHTFADAKTRKIEENLSAVLEKCGEFARQLKRQREEKRLREIERRRQEILERAGAERREAHKKLAHELERQSGAWSRARFLRRYLRAARQALGDQKITADFMGEQIDFLSWAEAYVEQLDPLTVTDRNPDQSGGETYYSTEEKLKESIRRLIGADWNESSKLLIG
jgi:hypothetical protein